MEKRAPHPPGGAPEGTIGIPIPRPTLHYRLKAWQAFQRALDPLAAPKPLRPPPRF